MTRWIRWWPLAAVVVVVASACGRGQVAPEASKALAPASVRAVQAIDEGTAVVLNERGLVLTRDRGRTWAGATPEGVKPEAIAAVQFLDKSTGWLVSTDDGKTAVRRTTDGGRSWKRVGSVVPSEDAVVVAVQPVSETSALVLARRQSSSNFSVGELWRTTDAGVSWRPVAAPGGGPVRFIGPSTGFVVAGAGDDELHVTRDGGATWSRSDVQPPPGLAGSPVYDLPHRVGGTELVTAVTFAGERSGIAFYRTTDAGGTWTFAKEIASTTPIAAGVRMASDVVDGDVWVAATADGKRVHSSRDTGRAWGETSPNGLPAGVGALDFATADVGWALVQEGSCEGFKTGCRTTGRLFATSDGGQTWSEVVT